MNKKASIVETSKPAGENSPESPPDHDDGFGVLSVEELAGVTGGAIEIVETRDA